MGLGVLEETKLEHVPGTVLLDDKVAHADVAGGLKHGTGRNAHIVLSPQPSEDPNDPLNWSTWKKELNTFILLFGAILHAGTNGPFLNASYFEMSQQLGMPINEVVMVSGYNLLAAGCIGPFVTAFSRKYGKRPVFLVSCLFDIVGTAIGGAKISYNYLLAARIIQGFSTSAYESLIIAAVGDMYFVHQRGLRISMINFILNAASSLSSVICGQVFQRLGWLWLFNLYQVFVVLQFLLQFFFVPESTYIRDNRYNTDVAKKENLGELVKLEQLQHHAVEVEEATGAAEVTATPPIPVKKTFVQELAVWTGTYSNDSIFKFLLGPFITLLNPAACFAIIASGLLNSWYVGSAIILAGIFSGPPWLFNASQIGWVGFGPFAGGMIGSIITAVLGDWLIKFMSRKNNGTYEPEFRLVFMAPTAIFCAFGMFFFGYALQNGLAAELCAFLQGVMMVGVLIGIFSTLSYGLDSFRTQANEIFVMNMLFKNFMFYGLSNFANPWVASKGPEEIMFVFGGTSLGLCLLAIPVYIFGKRLRGWWARNDLFVKFKMETKTVGGSMA